MAWTTPRTWVTNEVVTAALMNAHVRDNENYLLTGRLGGAIVDTAGNYTTTTYNTWLAVSTTRLRITYTPVTTKIALSCVATFTSGATTQQAALGISIDSATPYYIAESNALNNGLAQVLSGHFVLPVTAGISHTFDLYWQIFASAGTATLNSSATIPVHLSAIEVG